MSLIFALFAAALSLSAQDPVTIRVDLSKPVGPFKPIHPFFGYDEPNFTYTPNGRKLLGELGSTTGGPVYVRTHFMLATGEGTSQIKNRSATEKSANRFYGP